VGETDSVSVSAWTYGIKTADNADGYDGADSHVITEPTAKFESVPGSGAVNTITYELSRKKDGGWDSLGTNTDVDALFASVLAGGGFTVGTYRIAYMMTGNANYASANGARFFTVGRKSLIVTAATVEVYYGETASVGFDYSGLADNGCGTADTIEEVLTVTTNASYTVGDEVGGSYTTSAALGSAKAKYANYDISFVEGALTVKPRPVTIAIDNKSSLYDYNAASGTQSVSPQTLTFTAALGTAEGGLTLSGNPFYTAENKGNLGASFSYDNGNQSVVKLFTQALEKNGSILTQYVGNYPIFASYADETAKRNYVITVSSAYERDTETETAVKNYFYGGTTWDFFEEFVENYYSSLGGLAIGGNGDGTYQAGVYKIDQATLSLNQSKLSYRNDDGSYTEYSSASTGLIYDGMVKGYTATPNGENYKTEQIAAVYKLRGSADDGWTAIPKDVGTYDYQFVVTNPNYKWSSPGSYTPLIIEQRTLSASVAVTAQNLSDAPARAENYNSTQYYYRGAGNAYTLTYTFGNFVGSEPLTFSACGVECAKADGTQTAFATALFNPFTNVTSTYSGYVYT
ncbi:MAG: hypothetical protein K2H43_03560, partial [Clostridia bacterium]|nr:hypothetical protein [Clostridia bacterium]